MVKKPLKFWFTISWGPWHWMALIILQLSLHISIFVYFFLFSCFIFSYVQAFFVFYIFFSFNFSIICEWSCITLHVIECVWFILMYVFRLLSKQFCLRLFSTKVSVSLLFTWLNISIRCSHSGHQRENFSSLGLLFARKFISDTLSDFRSIASTSFVCSGFNFSWNFRVSKEFCEIEFYKSIQDWVFTSV